MKKLTINNTVLRIILPLCALTACDYLDVVPPEQPDIDDTMQNKIDAVEFISSCYKGVESTAPFYTQSLEYSTDEVVDPPLWDQPQQRTAWNMWAAGSQDTKSNGYWERLYNYIGHCHMFLNVLSEYHPIGSTEEDKIRWRAEAEFLKAYYHSRLLAMYGPVPIMDQRPPMTTLPEEFPGRSHYDYVVNYIVDKLDNVVGSLPDVGNADDWGRATASAAKAIKARVLLYAASDLWNGKFPFPAWKNKSYETPGYGKELVSLSYSKEKWERALTANLEALSYAENEGQRKLLDMDAVQNLIQRDQLPLPYVPGIDADTEEGKDFLKRVLLRRYIVNSDENDGNTEIIWGVFMTSDRDKINYGPWPKRVAQYGSNWKDGWCAFAPTLNTVEQFYTKKGKLPEADSEFPSKDEWFTSAGLDRPEIIKLNVGREPRFYADLSFDGDDYSPKMNGGKPLRINLRDANLQGYNPDLHNRDFTVTGYFTKKYTAPNILVSTGTGADNKSNYAKPLFRLAELYLNVAECYAALNDATNAIKFLNPIRKRAGIPELAESDITADMPIMEWVRNERFIELWGEGHRYYDVRRWMTAPQKLRAGVREGLNVEGAGKNPSFETLNQRTVIKQQFQWDNRMYLWPILSSEIYNNPQLVQAPNY